MIQETFRELFDQLEHEIGNLYRETKKKRKEFVMSLFRCVGTSYTLLLQDSCMPVTLIGYDRSEGKIYFKHDSIIEVGWTDVVEIQNHDTEIIVACVTLYSKTSASF